MRAITPDKAKARSMVHAAEFEMKFVRTVQVTTASASTIVRSVYENFRMLGDALLAVRGKEASGPDHHVQMIQELFTLRVATTRPLQSILNLKDLRNNVNYKGYLPSVKEAQDALDFANQCFAPVVQAVKKEIEQ